VKTSQKNSFVLSSVAAVLLALGACSPPPEPAAPAAAPAASASPVGDTPKPAASLEDAGPAAPALRDAELDAAQQEYVALLVKLSPESATALGIHDHDTELDTRDPAAWNALIESEAAFLRKLESTFAGAKLSRRAETDLSLMVHQLRVDLRRKREEQPLVRRPDLYASPMGALFLMTARDYAPAKDRASQILARIEAIPAVLAQGQKNLGAPPAIWTRVGMDRCDGAKAFFAEQRAFLLANLPGERARVDAAVAKATKAYQDFKTYLGKVVLPRSNGSFAAGKDMFEFLLREDYFVTDSAEQVRDMGKRIFDKTNAEMLVVAKRIDPKAKGWPEVTAKLKGNHPTAEGLLAAYRAEVQRARKFLVDKDVVPFPAGDDLVVMDTPVFQRSTITAAYDQPPPFDKNTRGLFFVTPIDKSLSKAKQEEMLRENDHGDIVDTSVHEAYPGHHLQLSFARLHPSPARKVTDAAIFSEGWALYSEELMAELGYYTDEERLLQLEWTLVRAARVVIDVGLHTAGMTYEAAIKMLTDEVHLERTLAESEVKRYTMSPTQPLAYLTGREMIFRMREREKARLGDKFSLKAFHAEVLSRGTIAPSLIELELANAAP
jgi:uncharacterized protein (DUF885 family)